MLKILLILSLLALPTGSVKVWPNLQKPPSSWMINEEAISVRTGFERWVITCPPAIRVNPSLNFNRGGSREDTPLAGLEEVILHLDSLFPPDLAALQAKFPAYRESLAIPTILSPGLYSWDEKDGDRLRFAPVSIPYPVPPGYRVSLLVSTAEYGERGPNADGVINLPTVDHLILNWETRSRSVYTLPYVLTGVTFRYSSTVSVFYQITTP